MIPTKLSLTPPTSNVSSTSSVSSSGAVAVASESIGTLMPEPKGADIGLVIAQMAIENAYTTRKQAREQRQHANAAMISAQREQLAQMRIEADKRFEAAQFEAYGKIGEGLAGVAGGLSTAGVLWSDSRTGGASDSRGSQGDGRQEVPKAEGYGTALGSLGKIGGGVASAYAAGHRHDADLAGAAAKAYEMEATTQKHAIENAEDEMKEAREHIRTALDFLRDFEAAQTKAMSSAIKG